MTIGEHIQKVRKAANMTQKELAEKLGVSHTLISQYERGQRNPKRETLERIVAAFGLTDAEWEILRISGEVVSDRIKVYEPVRTEERTYTINVTLDNENMSVEELQTAIIAMVEAAKQNNISVVALSELAAAAAFAISEKRKPPKKEGDTNAEKD